MKRYGFSFQLVFKLSHNEWRERSIGIKICIELNMPNPLPKRAPIFPPNDPEIDPKRPNRPELVPATPKPEIFPQKSPDVSQNEPPEVTPRPDTPEIEPLGD